MEPLKDSFKNLKKKFKDIFIIDHHNEQPISPAPTPVRAEVGMAYLSALSDRAGVPVASSLNEFIRRAAFKRTKDKELKMSKEGTPFSYLCNDLTT